MKAIKIIIKETLEYPVEIQAKTISEAKNLALERFKTVKPTNPPKREVEAISEQKFRTETQNSALHLWFSQYAEALQEKGITVKEFVDGGYEIFPSSYFLKEEIFKRILKKVSGAESTTELDRHEIFSQVQEYFTAMMLQVGDVSIPFPDQKLLDYEKYDIN